MSTKEFSNIVCTNGYRKLHFALLSVSVISVLLFNIEYTQFGYPCLVGYSPTKCNADPTNEVKLEVGKAQRK